MRAQQALTTWLDGDDLSREETEALFGTLMDGGLSDAMKAGLLVALRMKGESAAEIAGAALAMRRRVLPIPHSRQGVVDTSGTGGDGHHSFNVSTAAAVVASAAGAPMAKHGNRSVSSRSGSADVLEALGLTLETVPERAGKSLDEIGIAFLFAPSLHPAMREVVPTRKALGVRTVFNLLGPLTNPAGARRQVVGVYAPELVELIAEVLVGLGAEHALVVHGEDGLDEISVASPTRVGEVRDGEVRLYTVTPEELGVRRASLEEISGGSPQDNAELFRRMLGGEPGPILEITVANAGAALYVAGVAASPREGVVKAREAVASGAAAAKLEAMKRFSEP